MLELLGLVIQYLLFITIYTVAILGIWTIIKFYFVGLDFIDKITDKLKKKVRGER